MQGSCTIEGTSVYGVRHVNEVIDFINADCGLEPFQNDPLRTNPPVQPLLEFKDLMGQQDLKRAIEIAAVGGHHTIMSGPCDVGKSAVAKRLPFIRPPMSREETLENMRIYSVAQHSSSSSLITQLPFRTIHHTIIDAGLIGGGADAHLGEITLAHNGVLFMDEFAEFKPAALEALRQPLEDGLITIARNKATIQYPASFILIAAMNPCLCGYHNHPTRKCTCSKRALYWYRRKISGPLLDRFALQVIAEPVSIMEMDSHAPAESSSIILERVNQARQLQQVRYKGMNGVYNNAQMPDHLLSTFCVLEPHARKFLLERMDKLQLSARAYTKVLKVARTIADLAGKSDIELAHIAEAIHFRALDCKAVCQGQRKIRL